MMEIPTIQQILSKMIKCNLTIKLICLLAFLSALSFAQNELRVDYKAVSTGFKIDAQKEISKEQKIILDKTLLMMQNAINEQNISLYTKPKNQFLLITKKKMAIDGQFESNLGNSLTNLHSYLYGLDTNTVLGYNIGSDFIIKYENKFVEWNITKESKNILGFTCFKAVPKYLQSYEPRELNSYPTEVWFAPSINKRGGPLKYANLPGLILEVKSNTVTITAVNITDINEDKAIPKIDKKIISEKQAYLNAKATGAAIESRMKK